MALFNASQIDLIKQGLFKTPVKVAIEDRNYSFFRNNLFSLPSQGTRDDYLMLDYKNIGVVLPDEALKGADPERVNYGTGFNEKAIFGKYFNNEDEVSADQCDNRILQRFWKTSIFTLQHSFYNDNKNDSLKPNKQKSTAQVEETNDCYEDCQTPNYR